MDVIDLHWYPEAQGGGVRITANNNTAAVVAARVQAPRSLWDPTYTETSWITQWSTDGTPAHAGPDHAAAARAARHQRFQAGHEDRDHRVQLRRHEPHFRRASPRPTCWASSAAQNVFAATFWSLHSDADSQFVEGAFKMFLNYNGTGGAFGDTSVASATDNLSQTSIHASVDSTNPNRMVVVAINRTGSPVSTGIAVTHDRVFDHAEVYQLTDDTNPNASYKIVHAADINLNLLNAFQYTLPAWSVSTIVLISDGLPGDFNRDGSVDTRDYVVWRKSKGQVGNVSADGNEDNVVDDKDYQLWRSNLGRTSGAGTAVGETNVPEPAIWTTTVIAMVVLSSVRVGTHRGRRI